MFSTCLGTVTPRLWVSHALLFVYFIAECIALLALTSPDQRLCSSSLITVFCMPCNLLSTLHVTICHAPNTIATKTTDHFQFCLSGRVVEITHPSGQVQPVALVWRVVAAIQNACLEEW